MFFLYYLLINSLSWVGFRDDSCLDFVSMTLTVYWSRILKGNSMNEFSTAFSDSWLTVTVNPYFLYSVLVLFIILIILFIYKPPIIYLRPIFCAFYYGYLLNKFLFVYMLYKRTHFLPFYCPSLKNSSMAS